MINALYKIFSFFMNLWNSLSQEQKDKIIDIMVECFESVLRQFYRDNKGEASNG